MPLNKDKVAKFKKGLRLKMGISPDQPEDATEGVSLLDTIKSNLASSTPLDEKITQGLKKVKKKKDDEEEGF